MVLTHGVGAVLNVVPNLEEQGIAKEVLMARKREETQLLGFTTRGFCNPRWQNQGVDYLFRNGRKFEWDLNVLYVP